MLKIVGAQRLMAISTTLWGAVTIGTAFVTNWGQLMAVRVLLGAFEAGESSGSAKDSEARQELYEAWQELWEARQEPQLDKDCADALIPRSLPLREHVYRYDLSSRRARPSSVICVRMRGHIRCIRWTSCLRTHSDQGRSTCQLAIPVRRLVSAMPRR